MSPKRDLSGFAATGGLPAPPPPPPAALPATSPPANGEPAARADKAAAANAAPPADTIPADTIPAETVPAEHVPADGAGRRRSPAARSQGRAAKGQRSGGRPGRQRICVSLSLDTYELLGDVAEQRSCWKVEVVVNGLRQWADALTEMNQPTEPNRFRRKRSSTPTPFVMDLTPDELSRLDDLARRSGLSRSALVRRLIQLEATQSPPASGGAP